MRVYSGVLKRRLGLQPDPRQEGAHRPDPADARQPAREIKEILAGDIAACVGLKDVTTGRNAVRSGLHHHAGRWSSPEPVISQAVEPKTKADQEKMGVALGRLAQEDPSFRVRTDEESGQPSSPAWASCTWRSSSTA